MEVITTFGFVHPDRERATHLRIVRTDRGPAFEVGDPEMNDWTTLERADAQDLDAIARHFAGTTSQARRVDDEADDPLRVLSREVARAVVRIAASSDAAASSLVSARAETDLAETLYQLAGAMVDAAQAGSGISKPELHFEMSATGLVAFLELSDGSLVRAGIVPAAEGFVAGLKRTLADRWAAVDTQAADVGAWLGMAWALLKPFQR